ncbi:hypothetical protein NM688_g9323 [Phlebia brevispora]|uniref:Uncharacterized protein n=1 Tax=Phlebia brevispora TaxID=194682 RepID=A0ACC1RKG7_9APHY|nr:hypothetical protein NM688_g9323 [Phlebia brevispora]
MLCLRYPVLAWFVSTTPSRDAAVARPPGASRPKRASIVVHSTDASAPIVDDVLRVIAQESIRCAGKTKKHYISCGSSSTGSTRLPSTTFTFTVTFTVLSTIMSDTGRQSLTDKASAALKPDSEKSTTEHIGDKFKGNADSAASSVQPSSEKSYTQQIGDAFSSNSNAGTEPSIGDRIKNAVGMGDSNNSS